MAELSVPARLGLFAAGLSVLFAAALGVGRLTGSPVGAAPAGHAMTQDGTSGHAMTGDGTSGHATGADDAGHDAGEQSGGATGTSASAGGLLLDAPVTTLRPGVRTPFSFVVRDGDGAPVTGFDVEQGERMHLVLVERDLQRFAHLHPRMAPDGTWTTDLTLSPGSYRAVADSTVDGERRSLAVDLLVPGPLVARPLPAPAASARVAGFDVALTRDGDDVSFAVTRGGAPVALEDYLGAKGHLVAFRTGDLAYSHVHPVAGTTFATELPSSGTYRLFFQFQVAGAVHAAPFTLRA